MSESLLAFRPIDLEAHAPLCAAFRRDSYLCSFGVDCFFEEAGPGGAHYLERLRQRIERFPDGYVHVWQGDRIVGQMEMQVRGDPPIGYVNLFYLIEEMRGSGVAGQLHDYALDFCARHGVERAQLSVSPNNARAMAFYRKHGWRDLGPRPGREIVNLMERGVPALQP